MLEIEALRRDVDDLKPRVEGLEARLEKKAVADLQRIPGLIGELREKLGTLDGDMDVHTIAFDLTLGDELLDGATASVTVVLAKP